MTVEPVRIDLEVKTPGVGPERIAARCFAPDPARAAAEPVWLFCVPGASEDWTYFHFTPPGHAPDEYSFAAFMTARGIGVIAIDNLGTGDSLSASMGGDLSLDALVDVTAEAVARARERLVAGELAPGLGAQPKAVLVGVGHSGGAGLTIALQGRHACFDLLVANGMPAGRFQAVGTDPDQIRASISVDERGMLRIADSPQARAMAHFPDVPTPVVDYFVETQVAFPPSMPTMMIEGTLAPYAAQISSPAFVGFGEADLAAEPLSEPSFYSSSPDVTVYVQPGMSHIHSLAGTRAELWLAIHNWIWSRVKFGAPELALSAG